MKEPKIIGLREAMERLRDGLPVEMKWENSVWSPVIWNDRLSIYLDPKCSFRIPAEPEIVKPVVVEWPVDESGLIFNRENTPEAKGDCVLTIRPKSQQAERDRLEREFVEWAGQFDSGAGATLRDFIKKEMA